ncbi:MAG: PTS sugar transporter subunit IIB [Candidatus Krumholzibacteria bacterium]|nr:PTS sugar transporter subunit IIB [Candidatus Krumholzibacteria bacterium]
MPLSLVRIDDRLIHGQVVLGWSRVLKPDRIAIANDRIAKNSWERKFYTASVPPHIKVSFLTLEETAVELLNNLYKNEAVLMLFESVKDAYTMVLKGVQLDNINIGGLHYRDGAQELLPFVFLTEEDRQLLRELVKRGVTLLAQDVPGGSGTVINSMVV